jgi:5'-methylthioadenosine/S-adenosylhomocysteine nucleosidase
MIAIIGATSDDILYFKTKMSIHKTIKIYGDVEAYVGSFSKQDAIVCATGETNYMSSLIVGQIISKYEPYIVFNVGVVSSFSSQLNQGDIFIAERYYLANIDFSKAGLGQYGQIPGRGTFYVGDTSVNNKAETTAYMLTNRYVQRGFLLSGETFYMDDAPLLSLVKSHFLQESNLLAYDTSSAGVALACSLSSTAFLSIKAVNYQIGKVEQKLNYIRKGLEVMPTIGQIVTKMLLEQDI